MREGLLTVFIALNIQDELENVIPYLPEYKPHFLPDAFKIRMWLKSSS
jgi:hypothetical protein